MFGPICALSSALLREYDVWQMLFESGSGCYSWKHVAFKATRRVRPVTAPIFDVSLPVIKTICGNSRGFLRWFCDFRNYHLEGFRLLSRRRLTMAISRMSTENTDTVCCIFAIALSGGPQKVYNTLQNKIY